MFPVSSCSCLSPIRLSQVLSREWRCSRSSADRRCSNYIWVIDNFIAYLGAAYIRDLTVYGIMLTIGVFQSVVKSDSDVHIQLSQTLDALFSIFQTCTFPRDVVKMYVFTIKAYPFQIHVTNNSTPVFEFVSYFRDDIEKAQMLPGVYSDALFGVYPNDTLPFIS